MIRAVRPATPSIVEVESTPEERAAALAVQEEFRKNIHWFSANATTIREQHAGKYICIAAQELFVGDDPVEVCGRARTAHPESPGGFFSKRISTHRGPRIYANRRSLGIGR